MRVLILGAGGHAKVVADILLAQGIQIAGFLDDNQELWGTRLLGLPVLGPLSGYADHSVDGLIVAIGANRARKAVVERIGVTVLPWLSAVHPRATVAPSATIAVGTVVMAGAVINPDAVIGAHCIINTAATVDHDCAIGDFVHLAPGCQLAGGVQVGEGALLGIGSVVIPYCRIGSWSVVGAGGVVTEDLPPGVTAIGVPARPVHS